MTWFKIDDSVADHPRVLALLERRNGFAAWGLWSLCGAWSARHLTDGAISSSALKRLGGTSSLAKALVDSGLWERADNGYQFRNWLKWQPSRKSVHEKRGAAKQRMQRNRSREQDSEHDNPVRLPRPVQSSPVQSSSNGLTPKPPSLRSVALVFRQVTGHSVPSDIDVEWTAAERTAASRLLAWCRGDRDKLRAQLTRMQVSDPKRWLDSQPIKVWADRIGTTPQAAGSAPAPEDFDYANAETTI